MHPPVAHWMFSARMSYFSPLRGKWLSDRWTWYMWARCGATCSLTEPVCGEGGEMFQMPRPGGHSQDPWKLRGSIWCQLLTRSYKFSSHAVLYSGIGQNMEFMWCSKASFCFRYVNARRVSQKVRVVSMYSVLISNDIRKRPTLYLPLSWNVINTSISRFRCY